MNDSRLNGNYWGNHFGAIIFDIAFSMRTSAEYVNNNEEAYNFNSNALKCSMHKSVRNRYYKIKEMHDLDYNKRKKRTPEGIKINKILNNSKSGQLP